MCLLRRHRHAHGMFAAPEILALIKLSLLKLGEIMLLIIVVLGKHPLYPVLGPWKSAAFQVIIIFLGVVGVAVSGFG